ncbi:outer membrane beta-barrel protein [Myxococcota bacterium]|nr:outer membrane beta-barrel protein [Myxococcota bacterium]
MKIKTTLLILALALTFAAPADAVAKKRRKKRAKKPAAAAVVTPAEEVKPAPAEAPVAVSEEADSDKLGLSVGVKLGGVVPTSDLGATGFVALDVAYMPAALEEMIGLPVGVAFEFAYLEPTASGSGNDASAGDYSWDLSQRVITVAIDALAVMPMGDLKVYGALGYGFYFLKAEMDSYDTINTETQMRSGMQLRGGGAYAIGPGDVFAELRYHYVGLEFLTTGDANAGGVTMGLGYRINF